MYWYHVAWIVAFVGVITLAVFEARAQNRNKKEWMKNEKIC